MHRMNYYLLLAMLMSLLWGVFVLMVGSVLRYGLGQLIESYVEDVGDVVDLKATVNAAGVNICPIETAPGNDIRLGDWATVIGSLVVSTGILIIIYSSTGFVAAVLQSSILMLLLLFMIVIVYCLEYYIFQVSTDIYNTFHESAQKQMVDILRSDYILSRNPNMFTKTMNAIMLKTQCCGIRGPEDFRNLSFNDGEQTVYFSVSPACCKKSVFSSKQDIAFLLLIDCARIGYSHLINSLGCYSELFDYVSNNYGTLIIVGLIVLVIWQIVQVVLIIMLLFTPPKEEKAAPVKPRQDMQFQEMVSKKPKKFIPYWKASSYLPEDVQRIRSTEIW